MANNINPNLLKNFIVKTIGATHLTEKTAQKHGIDAQKFEEANVKLVTIGNYSTMLEAAVKTNYIKESDIAALEQWRKDPANWVPNNDSNAE